MTYGINYNMHDEDDGAEFYVEPNKDEVIDRLVWLLRRLEYSVTVEYPDGEVY